MAWDVATARQLFSIPIQGEDGALVYSQEGASLIVGTTGRSEGGVVFYNAATGEEQRSIPMPSSPNGYRFIDVRHQLVGGDVGGDFVFCDLASGKEGCAFPKPASFVPMLSIPTAVALSWRLASLNTGETELTFWSLKSGRRLLAFNCPARVSALSFSPDGNRLIVAFAHPTLPVAAAKPSKSTTPRRCRRSRDRAVLAHRSRTARNSVSSRELITRV